MEAAINTAKQNNCGRNKTIFALQKIQPKQWNILTLNSTSYNSEKYVQRTLILKVNHACCDVMWCDTAPIWLVKQVSACIWKLKRRAGI